MKFATVLGISLVVLLESLSVRSCYVPRNSDSKNTRCRINKGVDGTREDLINNTTWTVVDSTEGTVLVQFPFLNRSIGGGNKCPTEYKLTLKVKDGQHFMYHSMHTVWVVENNNSYFCDKVANVTFTHMYTGTYQLHIQVGCSCVFDDVILTENITTSYKKPSTSNTIGRIEARHQMKEVMFAVKVDTDMMYTIRYNESCNEDCKAASKSRSSCKWKVLDGIHKTYEENCIVDGCSLIEGPTTICSWVVDYSQKNTAETLLCNDVVKGKFSLEEKTYDITVQNVTAGCYCVTAEKLDSRVDGNSTIWGNLCRKAHSPFVLVKPVEPGDLPPVIVASMPVTLIVMLCVVTLFMPVMLWIIWKYLKGRHPPANKREGVPGSNDLKKVTIGFPKAEILLLYPRDCEPFMKLMKQFKELLKVTCKCEVLDYHDQEHSAEIDREGNSWLLKKINSPTTKIILVENICSVLCQQARFVGVTVKPAVQCCRDNFFTLALVELTPNKHTVFVIRFNVDLAEEATLKCISKGVRYIMPDHLKKLIIAMGFCISEDVVQIDKETEMALTNSINSYISYTNDNKNYIMDLYKKC